MAQGKSSKKAKPANKHYTAEWKARQAKHAASRERRRLRKMSGWPVQQVAANRFERGRTFEHAVERLTNREMRADWRAHRTSAQLVERKSRQLSFPKVESVKLRVVAARSKQESVSIETALDAVLEL